MAGKDELNHCVHCVSCEFHFKDSINKHANKLNSNNSKSRFKSLANDLLTAVSPFSYKHAYGKMAAFINEKPSKHKSFRKIGLIRGTVGENIFAALIIWK